MKTIATSLYSKLTPAERLAAIVAAKLRNDEADLLRLESSGMTRLAEFPLYYLRSRALYGMIVMTGLRLQGLALARDKAGIASELAAWSAWCAEQGIDAVEVLRDIPEIGRVIAMAEKTEPAAGDVDAALKRLWATWGELSDGVDEFES